MSDHDLEDYCSLDEGGIPRRLLGHSMFVEAMIEREMADDGGDDLAKTLEMMKVYALSAQALAAVRALWG